MKTVFPGNIREPASCLRPGGQHVPQPHLRPGEPVRHHLRRERGRQDGGRQVHHELPLSGFGHFPFPPLNYVI